MGSAVWGLEFGIQDLGFVVQGSHFGVQRFGFMCFGFRASGSGLRVPGSGAQDQFSGFEFRTPFFGLLLLQGYGHGLKNSLQSLRCRVEGRWFDRAPEGATCARPFARSHVFGIHNLQVGSGLRASGLGSGYASGYPEVPLKSSGLRSQLSSHRMYLSISFRRSTLPQNRRLLDDYL